MAVGTAKIVLQSLFTSVNVKRLGGAAAVGLVGGILQTLISRYGLEDIPGIQDAFASREYLLRDGEVMYDLWELRRLLDLQDGIDWKTFWKICDICDLLVGYEQTLGDKRCSLELLGFDAHRTAEYQYKRLTRLVLVLAETPFRVPSLGSDVCAVLQKIQDRMKDCVHNVRQEVAVKMEEFCRE